MKNICDWNNCNELGEYKAPVERDNSKKFRMLCLKHVKEFNKNWNYFSGMNDQQVLNFLKSDMIWHKPTQSFSSSDNFFKVLWNNTLKDEFDKNNFITSLNWFDFSSNWFDAIDAKLNQFDATDAKLNQFGMLQTSLELLTHNFEVL